MTNTETRGSRRSDYSSYTLCWSAAVVAVCILPPNIGLPATPSQHTDAITVDDPRPLAAALRMFEDRYGWIVTYEDPRYEHTSEIADVTEAVRRDGRFDKRVLVPKGGVFSVEPARPSPQATVAEISATLTTFLDAYQASGNAGVFRLTNTGVAFHVSPAKVRLQDGRVVTQPSVLDVTVSLIPRKDRSVSQAIKETLDGVSQATGHRLAMGTVPTNLFVASSFQEGAVKQTARELLMRILDSTGLGLSWQLFYDPGLRFYAFNVHVVKDRQ